MSSDVVHWEFVAKISVYHVVVCVYRRRIGVHGTGQRRNATIEWLLYIVLFELETKQYLRDMQSVNQTMKRSELLNNLQSSLKCGLCVGHYLWYKCNIDLIHENNNYFYFKNALQYIDALHWYIMWSNSCFMRGKSKLCRSYCRIYSLYQIWRQNGRSDQWMWTVFVQWAINEQYQTRKRKVFVEFAINHQWKIWREQNYNLEIKMTFSLFCFSACCLPMLILNLFEMNIECIPLVVCA